MSERSDGIVAAYLAGERWSEIGARFDVGPATIRKALIAADVSPLRRPHSTYRRTADLIEDAEWLADDGADLSDVLQRLGVKKDSFHRALCRADRLDLYWRLAGREPDAEFRRRCSSRLRAAS